MARFNAVAERPTLTTNMAGGEAYAESPRLELASLVLTSLLNDQFYRKADTALARLRELIPLAGADFSAKVALFARHEHGLRSISHAIAGELGQYQFEGKRGFYQRIVRRPDDVTEILAYYYSNRGRKLPKAMQRGLADAVGGFSRYGLAKYKGESRGLKMVDAVNILHPKPSKDPEAFTALVAGTLVEEDTWESRLSAAGKDAEAKAAVWAGLLAERKVGYMALLKNLRNIAEQSPAALPVALAQLVDPDAVKSSLVFPFRFITAAREVGKLPGTQPVMRAISEAANISVSNIPTLTGSTLVAVDVSGSMQAAVGGNKETSCMDVAIMFGAAFAQQGADVLLFTDDAKYVTLRGTDLFGDMAEIHRHVTPRGTNFHAIFKTASRAYDNIVILSDMQAWVDGGNPKPSLAEYRTRTGANPRIFSFDLTGYGSLQFPEANVYALAGFSDRAFDLLAMLQEDRGAMVRRIEAYS